MSRLRIRHLRVRASTDEGVFGADISFGPGLNVLEAANSRGKTICTQSIMYALGMEAMLGPRHDVPLPDAMTKELLDESGQTLRVQESRVWLELEGIEGHPVTLARWARHPTIDTHLVSVWDGPALTTGGTFPQHDHLVRQEGVMEREVGLHHFLARLVGWEPPKIVVKTGGDRMLYLEYLFALVFVEQRGGWAGIQALKPQFFLPEAEQRAVEFMLGMSLYERIRDRLELTQRVNVLVSEWIRTRSSFEEGLRGTGLVLSGIPEAAVASWPLENDPGLLTVEGHLTVPTEIGRILEQIEEADRILSDPSDSVDQEAADRLGELEDELLVLSAATRTITAALVDERETRAALERSLERLRADLQRNRDAERIKNLGSEAWATEEPDCPTCHRPLQGILLASSAKPAMSLAENIVYLRAEIQTFSALRDSSARAHEEIEERLASHRRRQAEMQQQIRALRTALTAPSGAPSAAAIEQQLQARRRLDELRHLEAEFADLLESLADIASALNEARTKLKALPPTELSSTDESKLRDLERRVIEQAHQYSFDSFDPSEIRISRQTYRPSRNGADIGFGISASDGIRLIWAFLLGLLEIARDRPTNHPGLVIFDEPRQQSASRPSLDAFLARASKSLEHDQQVILATSEQPDALKGTLSELDHVLVTWPGRLLKRVSAPSHA